MGAIRILMRVGFVTLALCAMQSCKTKFDVQMLRYNDRSSRFEYQNDGEVIAIRTDGLKLLDSSNIAQFMRDSTNFTDLYTKILNEENRTVGNNDLRLTKLYARAVDGIINAEYRQTIKSVDSIFLTHPQLKYFSDCNFLKGYANEKLGEKEIAKWNFRLFCMYSQKTYSSRFHGYRDADSSQDLHCAERVYANNFIKGKPTKFDEDKFLNIIPKFYYSGNMPGYTMNPEELFRNTKFDANFYRGPYCGTEMSFGVQILCRHNRFINSNVYIFANNIGYGGGLGLPMQLFKSRNNRVGVKLSPFVEYSRYSLSSKNDGNTFSWVEFINYGAKLSSGVFITQRFSLGGSYYYYHYNENNKYVDTFSAKQFWKNNELDLSAYYLLWQKISLKMGAHNQDFVAGLYGYGIELSYNFSNPGLIFRTNLY